MTHLVGEYCVVDFTPPSKKLSVKLKKKITRQFKYKTNERTLRCRSPLYFWSVQCLKNSPDEPESLENLEGGEREKELPKQSIDNPQIVSTKSLPDSQTVPNSGGNAEDGEGLTRILRDIFRLLVTMENETKNKIKIKK